MRKSIIIVLLVSMVGFLSASTRFGGRSSSVRIGQGITFDLNTDLAVDEGTVRIDNGGSLTGDNDKYANFSQGHLEYHDYDMYFTGRLDMDEASHDVELYTDGDLVRSEVGTIIDGINLEAGVSGTILGQPFLDDTITLSIGNQLYIGIQSRLNKNIESLGDDDNCRVGVILQDDLKLEDDVVLDIVGTISFNGKNLQTGGKALTWSSKNQTWYNAADLTLGGDLTLNSTIVFDGSATTTSYIIGNRHSIDMNEKTIFVARDHTLRIENATIKNLKGESDGTSSAGALEMDDGAVIELKDVTILQDASTGYTINKGTAEIVEGGFLKIVPGSTTQDFTFATGATSFNIKSRATLLIGRDARFVYNNSTATLLVCEDATSEVSLDNGTLKSSSDLTFANGTIITDGKSTLDTDSNTITLATTSDIVVMPAATLELSGAGTVHYGAALSSSEWPDTETSKEVLSSPVGNDNFGRSVAISGNYAIVGAPYRDITAGFNEGSAYIFERSEGTWILDQTLTASDKAANDYFGYSVGISGDYAIIGANQDDDKGNNTGSAYIYYNSGGSWSAQAKLYASSPWGGAKFGASCAISGDYAIVGAPYDAFPGVTPGRAYIFKRSGTDWGVNEGGDAYHETQAIDLQSGINNNYFGTSVSISGDYALVGAYGVSSNSGKACIFARSGDVWGGESSGKYYANVDLTASDGDTGDMFGGNVGISGDYAIVGAEYEDPGGISSAGSAYIYERSGASWPEAKKIQAGDADDSDYFATSVAISGDIAIVGAYGDGPYIGSAYIYERSGGVWGSNQGAYSTQTKKIVASDEGANDNFGSSVAISGNYSIVGAPGFSSSQGKIYFFEKS